MQEKRGRKNEEGKVREIENSDGGRSYAGRRREVREGIVRTGGWRWGMREGGERGEEEGGR